MAQGPSFACGPAATGCTSQPTSKAWGQQAGCHEPYSLAGWSPNEPQDLTGCDCFGHNPEALLQPPAPPPRAQAQAQAAFFRSTPQFCNPISVPNPPIYQLVNSQPWNVHTHQTRPSEPLVEWQGVRGGVADDDDNRSENELSTIESESECGEMQTPLRATEEEAGAHPCVRVWGQCKYGEDCIFASLPREYCVFCLRRAPHKKCDGVMPEPEDLPQLSQDVMDKVADHAQERKKNQQARRAKRRAAKRKEQKAAAREKKEAEALISGP